MGGHAQFFNCIYNSFHGVLGSYRMRWMPAHITTEATRPSRPESTLLTDNIISTVDYLVCSMQYMVAEYE